MVRIACGSTRFVLLIGNNAIKIGKFRPLCLIVRLMFLPFSRKRREHFFKKYGPTFLNAVYNDLFAGLVANRGEYEYFQTSSDSRVIPSIHQWLGGWVIIQLRGSPVSADEFSIVNLLIPSSMKQECCEVNEPEQFCHHPEDRRIVLVDYGRRITREALRQTI